MSIADELTRLQELRTSGVLTDAEFATAKERILNGRPADSAAEEHLGEIKKQNELARLDREWAMEREQYMVHGRYGYRYLPSRGLSLISGVAICAFGLLWTVFAAGMGAPVFFPLFGVLFILFGAGVSAYAFMQAKRYEDARLRYQRRRQELLDGERRE
jgi:hypothetical protein